jgi:hypothetical protein
LKRRSHYCAVVTVLCVLAAGRAVPVSAGTEADQETWIFDNVDRIGGHTATVLGHPRVIDSPAGKAVEFNGIDDAILIGVHPLAGARTFTWEAVFRPDGGNAEQRWFHLEENPADGSGANNRMLFEIRVVDGRWCLDAFDKSSSGQKTLIDRGKLQDVGVWYHVAAVYDGQEFRSYINRSLQSAGPVQLAPQGEGRTAIGVRMNRVNYFKGAIHMARFTRRALAPAEFLPTPLQR